MSRTHCRAPPEKKRVTGVSEQAVLGGGIPNANDVDSAPRSHDDGVAIAAVVRLYGAPFNSASRGQARAAPGYARHIRGPQIAYLGLCERQYRPVAGGAGYINCGVRGPNDGAAARLYSQPGVVVAKRIGRIVDGYIVDYIDSDVSATRTHARAISGVDCVNAACAGGDVDLDTRLKREIDARAKAVNKVGRIYVDAGRIGVAERRTDSVAGRTRATHLRQRRFRYAHRQGRQRRRRHQPKFSTFRADV